MKKCVYTSLVNNYDTPRVQPVCSGWDYICICDDQFDHDVWKCIEFDKGSKTNALASRWPKIFPHKFLKDYDYSVYIDASITITGDIQSLCEQLNWPIFCTGIHPDRKCVFDEIAICKMIGKGNPSSLKKQKEYYCLKKMPKNFGLFENGVLFRNHNNSDVITLESFWWDQLNEFSHRDQISLPFVLWYYNLSNIISCFPEGFKKNNFRIPTVHSGRPKIRALSEAESGMFNRIKSLTKLKTQVVCYRSPCILSDYMNCHAIAFISFLHKPFEQYPIRVLYNLFSQKYSIEYICNVIEKSINESETVFVLEDNLSKNILFNEAAFKVKSILNDRNFKLNDLVDLYKKNDSSFLWNVL